MNQSIWDYSNNRAHRLTPAFCIALDKEALGLAQINAKPSNGKASESRSLAICASAHLARQENNLGEPNVRNPEPLSAMQVIITAMIIDLGLNMDKIIQIARNEIKFPSLALTKQYLTVNTIELANGEFVVERIAKDNSHVIIYYKIANERYFFGITIDNSTLEVIHTFIENGNKCALTCTSDILNIEQLSKFTKLTHTSGWSKGDQRTNQKSKYDFTRVNYELLDSECYDTEEALNELLNILETDISGILNLTANSNAYISICKYQYISSNPGFHIDVTTMSRLAKLNLPVDIDTYIVGNKILNE